jgi:molybdenum cofactor biosynthesis protein B
VEKSLKTATAHCVVLTIQDGTSASHDSNGKLVESMLHAEGHEVVYRRVVKHTSTAIREAIAEALADEECEVIIASGGDGLSRKDEAFETFTSLFEKRLEGFAGVLHALAFSESGASCLLTRPTAGIIEGHPVFSLPDDPVLLRVGLEKLILPQLSSILAAVKH